MRLFPIKLGPLSFDCWLSWSAGHTIRHYAIRCNDRTLWYRFREESR